MASNIRQFDAALQRHGDKVIPEQAAEHQQQVAIQALTRVVRLTPVASGRARGAWRVRASRAAGSFPNTPDRDGSSTIARGIERIKRFKPFRRMFLTNGAPYAWRLEHGWSKQANAGMVRITFEALRSRIGRATVR